FSFFGLVAFQLSQSGKAGGEGSMIIKALLSPLSWLGSFDLQQVARVCGSVMYQDRSAHHSLVGLK
ncbi:hypothetical protein ORJ00_15970, partial [Rheinheimera baltica]|uniref:hypothetical protein n=1 Tax=Rheinheimera baltica TaxID=67576 RepID=UPI00273D875A